MKYKKEYFNWQKEISVFGGIANKFKFEKHIDKEDVVIDFGSGGGYLLNNIICKEKIGIEINKFARVEAKKLGIDSVESMNKVKDNYVDVIISNHALEHTGRPLDILKQLYLKLKKGEKIIFVVPYDGPEQKYNSKDINQHLYTWNRQL
jgi:SAM-dependent methyltransferase